MYNEEMQVQYSQHALLAACGWISEHIGLFQAIERIHLDQKCSDHMAQTKVLEFLVAILARLKHLQEEISQLVHPLDRNPAVVEAWGQGKWADYSGVSRPLSSLCWARVCHLVVGLIRSVGSC
jgi:hypothetical protein